MKATPAQLFVNLNTGKVGEVGTRDTVVFDEIANTDFSDPKAFVSIMQGYMQDAKFSRGKKEKGINIASSHAGNLIATYRIKLIIEMNIIDLKWVAGQIS